MVKVQAFIIQQWLCSFTMSLVEGSSEMDYLDIYLTPSFGVRNSAITSAMMVMFFKKMFKI